MQTLSNELSVEQMQVLMNEIDTKGIKKATKDSNWEKLMRVVLSDHDTSKQLAADEKGSPICPRIWEGVDIVEEERMQITGYYYYNKQYYIDLYCPGEEDVTVALGSTLPSDVAIRVTRATAWDMAGEQLGMLLKIYLSLPLVTDFTYAYCVENGLTGFLPEGISPSDVPYLGDLLSELDPLDHTAHIQKETIFVETSIEHGGNSGAPYSKTEEMTRFRERH